MSGQRYLLIACVLGAGASRRMGTNKLSLRSRNHVSFLHQVIDRMIKSDVESMVLFDNMQTAGAYLDLPESIERQTIPNGEFSATVRAAIEYAQSKNASHVMIALGDMPEVTTQDINALVVASKNQADAFVCATYKGRVGNPVILPLLNSKKWIADISGDSGARGILKSHHGPMIEVECGPGVILDIDTPQDYDDYLRT
ncbi:MAG: nucleotidyltransferase family protein [Ahrensia sp.]|nr:nucleotidyltransferase family protein [Ahrensia sp.]